MELTKEEKQAILDQRLKQFAVEKYGHEINKEFLIAQEVDAIGETKDQLAAEIAKTDEAIAILDKAMLTAEDIKSKLPKAVEPEVVEAVK